MDAPVQEAGVGMCDGSLLSQSDEVSLLLVRNGPTLLDLAQLLQALVEALTHTFATVTRTHATTQIHSVC